MTTPSATPANADAIATIDRLADEFVSRPKTLLDHDTPSNSRPPHISSPLIEKRGDLFAEPGVTHLAHCISADCKMGAGIAKSFVARFGPTSFRRRVAAMSPVVGSIVSISTESGKTVYNLITKEKYYDKPLLVALIESLMEMRSHARANGVKRIAMPRIGCGLDGLQWAEVRRVLDYLFSQSGIEILVIDLDAPRTARLPEREFGETDVREKKRLRVIDEPAPK